MSDDLDYLYALVACTFLVVVISCGCLLIGVDLGQPQPTSNLITKTITISSIDTAFPGFSNELFDSDGNGYYYVQWFKPIRGVYNITYYCNKDGNRQIYKFVDMTPKPADKAKCVIIHGVCQ